MDQKGLSFWLKLVLVGVAICGAAVYFVILPVWGDSIVTNNPEFADWFWPWLIFLWGTSIPCAWALVCAWGVFDRIGRDESFSVKNARALKRISYLAAADAVYFFVGQVVLFLANRNHPGVLLLSQLIVFAAVGIAVASAALSHLVYKAAALREENELTI